MPCLSASRRSSAREGRARPAAPGSLSNRDRVILKIESIGEAGPARRRASRARQVGANCVRSVGQSSVDADPFRMSYVESIAAEA